VSTTIKGANVASKGSGHTAPGPAPVPSMILPMAPPTPTGVPAPFLYVAQSKTASPTSDKLTANGGPVLTIASVMQIENPGNMVADKTLLKDLVSHAHVKKAKMLEADGVVKGGDRGVVKTGHKVKQNLLTAELEACQSIGPLLDGVGFTKACANPKDAGIDIITLAEPVAVVGGSVVESAVDLTLPGMIPVEWTRSYASSDHKQHGLLGRGGWVLGIEQRVEADDEGFVLHQMGAKLRFSRVEVGEVSFLRSHRLELRPGREGRCTVRIVDSGLLYEFEPVVPAGPAVLQQVRDSRGNHVSLEWREGRLARVVDTAKRTLEISYDSVGRLTAVQVWARAGLQVELRYVYDEDGCLSAAIDPEGAAEQYVYDGLHRLVRKVRRNGVTFHYRYDDANRCCEAFGDGGAHRYEFTFDETKRCTVAHGNPEPMTVEYDEQGRVTRLAHFGDLTVLEKEYDPDGYVTKLVDKAGAEESFEWDARGRLVSYVDPAGGRLQHHYRADRLVQRTFPDESAVTFDWDEHGTLVGLTDVRGRTETLAYDAFGRLIGVFGPEGTLRRWDWDEEHNIIREEDAAGRVIEYTWDALGHQLTRTEVSRAGERFVTRSEWDRCGRQRLLRYANGVGYDIEHDGEGNVVKVTDHLGRVTSMRYVGVGRLAELVAVDGGRWTISYDPNGRIREVKNPRGEPYAYRYDRAGRCVETRSFDGRVTKLYYNDRNLVSRVEHQDGGYVAWTHDVRGLVTSEVTPESSRRYERNEFGVLLKAVVDEGGESYAVEFVRDSSGRAIKVRQGDHEVDYTYDEHDRVIERSIDGAAVTRYGYNLRGDLTTVTHGDTTVRLQRDSLGLEVGRVLPAASITARYNDVHRLQEQTVLSRDGQPLASRRWTFAASGLPVRLDDSSWGTSAFSHDDMGRLTGFHHGGYTERVLHDAAGRPSILRAHEDPESWISRLGGVVLQTPRATFEVDDRRRRIARRGDGGTVEYTWDAHNRLRVVSGPRGTVEFSYDAAGRRVLKRVTPPAAPDALTEPSVREVRYLWEGDTLIAEYDSDFGRRVFVHEPRTLAPMLQEEQGEVFAYVLDDLGTTHELIDARGRIAWTGASTPYGETLHARVDPASLFHRPRPIEPAFRRYGQYWDEDVELGASRHRWFDPASARWLIPDPLGLAGGFDHFAFTGNPTSGTDALGLAQVGPNGTCEGHGYVRFKTDPENDPNGVPMGVKAAITPRMVGDPTSTDPFRRGATGTHADGDIRPNGFTALQSATGGNAARGHLLARCLGGSGDYPANLVTLYQRPVNTPQMSGVEVSVRDTVRSTGAVVNYESTPNYGSVAGAPPTSVTITATSGGSSVLPPTVGSAATPVTQSGGATTLSNTPGGGFSAP